MLSPSPDYQQVFDADPRARAIIDAAPEGCVIVAANRSYLSLLGAQREAIIGQSLSAALSGIVNATDVSALLESCQKVSSQHGEDTSLQLRTASRTLQVAHRPLVAASGNVEHILQELVELDSDEPTDSLAASEARFRGTFDNAAVGIAHVGLDGRWLRVNDKLCNIVGYTREALLVRTYQDITHPEDLPASMTNVQRMLAGQLHTYSMEKRYIRADGSPIWINLTVSRTRAPSGEQDYFISIVEDISERKLVSLALRESEARFRALADNMSQLAWLADPSGARAWFNRRWLDYTGTTLPDVMGWHWPRVHPAEQREQIVSSYRQNLANAQAWTETCEILDARGIPRWFLTQTVPIRDDHGQVIRWVGTHTDITAEREAERAHERAHFFELSPDMVCIATAAGSFLHLSTGFTSTLGYALHDLLGRSLLDFVHPDDRSATVRELEKLDAGLSALELTKRFRDRDGQYRWLQWRLAPSPEGMIYAIARDVSADRELLESQRLAERDLRENQASLQAGLREREVLLQEIHHRVKNNLQVISSLINMQARRLKEPLSRTALEECRTRVEAIALIHEQLYQSKDYRQIPFAKYLASLIRNIVGAAGGPAQRVSLAVEPERLQLPVDKAIPCGLILNELVTNALKHAFPHGRRGEVQVSLHAQGNELVLCVSDDGVGMSSASTPSSHSLGMQLVETLVEQLNGRVTNTPSEGTTFRITCPLRSPG